MTIHLLRVWWTAIVERADTWAWATWAAATSWMAQAALSDTAQTVVDVAGPIGAVVAAVWLMRQQARNIDAERDHANHLAERQALRITELEAALADRIDAERQLLARLEQLAAALAGEQAIRRSLEARVGDRRRYHDDHGNT